MRQRPPSGCGGKWDQTNESGAQTGENGLVNVWDHVRGHGVNGRRLTMERLSVGLLKTSSPIFMTTSGQMQKACG
jgi:hypothetical protein